MSTEVTPIKKKKALTPKLRFRPFQDSWNVKPLGDVIQIKSGFGFKANEYAKEGVRLLQIENVSYGIIKWNENTVFLPKEYLTAYPELSLKDSDIVLALNRPVTNDQLKISKISKRDEPAILYQRVGKVSVIDNQYASDFIYHLFTKDVTLFVLRHSIGSDQPFISVLALYKHKSWFPSLPEQQKIASFLSAVDEKIQQLKRKKELLEQYKKGVMQQLFSGKLRFKDENGKTYPSWEEKKLSEVSQIRSGISTEQSDKGKYKVTRIETISAGVINEDKVGLIDSVNDFEEYKLRRGDILFSNINSISHIGKTAIAKTDLDIYHGMNLLCFKVSEGIYPQFLFYFLNTEKTRNYFKSICNQAVSQASINQTSLGKTKIFIPVIDEQQTIASFLTAVDAKIESVATQIAHFQTFKKGLLQQMFV